MMMDGSKYRSILLLLMTGKEDLNMNGKIILSDLEILIISKVLLFQTNVIYGHELQYFILF